MSMRSSEWRRSVSKDICRPIADLTREELERELEQIREALVLERQKRQSLEQQILLEGCEKAGSSRRAKVTGICTVLGSIFILLGWSMFVVQIFGLGGIDGDVGYAWSTSLAGGFMFLLGITPADRALVRFAGGFFAQAWWMYVALDIVVVSMWLSGHLCLYSGTTCWIIYISLAATAAILACGGLACALTLRQLPGSERVPFSRVWAHHAGKVGRWPAAAFVALAPLAAWAIAQPDSSFVLSPRVALRRLWIIARLGSLGWGVLWLGALAAGFALGKSEPVLASMAFWSITCLLQAAVFTARNRSRVHEFLGNLGRKDQTNAAAVVAAVVGGLPAKQVFQMAEGQFRGIQFDSLTHEDFASNDLAGKEARDEDLRARTTKRKLGGVDVFLSHSWHDPLKPKWCALEAWAGRFAAKNSGRSPYLWLDKACLDQTNISQSLACLPVFLAGCKTLLVVAGPTYTQRLWCIMEIFTFTYMGGAVEHITLLPIGEGAQEADALSAIFNAFAMFDAGAARCFKPEDKEALLGVIESGTGSIDAFNTNVREIFTQMRVGRKGSGQYESV